MNTCKFTFILYKLSPFQTLWLLKYKLLNLSTRFYILFFLAFFSPHYQEQVISTWKTHLSFVWKLETHQFHTSSKAAFMVTVHLVTGGACLKWCCICWRLPAGHLLIFVIGRVFTAILIIFWDRTLKSQTKEIIKTEICNNLKTWDYMGGGGPTWQCLGFRFRLLLFLHQRWCGSIVWVTTPIIQENWPAPMNTCTLMASIKKSDFDVDVAVVC